MIRFTAPVRSRTTRGGWDGVDDSASAGSAAHVAFVQQIQALFGVTGVDANGDPFNEGWALSNQAGFTSRPFNTLVLTVNPDLARVACSTVGFNTFQNPVNNFAACRFDYNQRYDFIGAWLARPNPAAVPEPASMILVASGLLAAARRRFKKH